MTGLRSRNDDGRLVPGAEECVFCEIVAGRAEATFVHEDEAVVAFLTISPVTPGHLLVVPRKHLPDLSDIDGELGAHIFNVAQRMARALRSSSLRCEGINLFYADGAAAFQEVFHAHLHVFARFEVDNFTIGADWDQEPSRAELDSSEIRFVRRCEPRSWPSRETPQIPSALRLPSADRRGRRVKSQ